MRKRGDAPISETGHVAILILLIALMILAYFILLPDEDRREALDLEEVKEKTGETVIILSETPGHIYPYSKETEEKKIPSLNLFSEVKTSAQSLASKVHVKRNIFLGQHDKLDFVLDDLSRVKSLGLLFNIVKSKGGLVLDLNGREVFRGKVETGDLPIELPVNYLKVNNELKISVSNPTWRFLSTNYYDLKDVQLIKRYRMENKFEQRDFVVYDRDKVKNVELSFYVNCMDVTTDQGHLDITINDAGLFNGRVHCATDRIKLDIDKGYLKNGVNILTFEIDKGNYVFEHMILELDLEKEYYPEYYFVVDEKEGDYEIFMDFAPDDLKRATLYLNGKDFDLATEDEGYSKDITDYIIEDENHLKIVAKEEFTITNLQIIQEK